MHELFSGGGLLNLKLSCSSVNHVVGHGGEAVSDVSVTDGVADARAISFFTLSGGKIVKIVEFWPEPYAPPSNRQHLTEALV